MQPDSIGHSGYLRPRSLADALSALAGGGARIIAGATDLYPASVGRPLPGPLVDVTAIAELRGIKQTAQGLRIGGATTWSDIAAARLDPAFHGLQQAARQVGSVQIQNRATIAGNLCNASPAADGVPPLLVLGAGVELASVRGTRVLPLQDFITGYRKTAAAPDEVLTALLVPPMPAGAQSIFRKLGARKYLVISIIMVAVLVRRSGDGSLAEARIAVGAAAETARRLAALEQALAGLPPGHHPGGVMCAEHFDGLAPIDDLRARAGFRMDASRTLVADALMEALAACP